MRVIHTADWHIGQRLHGMDRYEEHEIFLNWLLLTIEEQQVEALVVAGDIFDSSAPTPRAQQLYYYFLAAISKSVVCKNVVIVGGNHDNPHLLQASAPILKHMNVHVLGAIPEEASTQILQLPNAENPQLIVVAIPYLWDRDIRKAVAGQDYAAREEALRAGITAHYTQMQPHLAEFRERGIPVLATGHLFAQGGIASEQSERNLPVGNLGGVSVAPFAGIFDYIALGHLHKNQVVGTYPHVRYCGSPLPLSFSESAYQHQVLMLDFSEGALQEITPLPIPVVRQLLRKRGAANTLADELETWQKPIGELAAWVELEVLDTIAPSLVNAQVDKWNEAFSDKLRIVKPKFFNPNVSVNMRATQEETVERSLLENPLLVFQRLLQERGLEREDAITQNLCKTFEELLALEDDLENN